jgi:hypothetical protein
MSEKDYVVIRRLVSSKHYKNAPYAEAGVKSGTGLFFSPQIRFAE